MRLRTTSRVVTCLAVSLAIAGAAGAAQIEVTTNLDTVADDGLCSLREAIDSANQDLAQGGCTTGSGHDEILLAAGTYSLTRVGSDEDGNESGDLDVLSSLVVLGQGKGVTIVDGNATDRVFDVPGQRQPGKLGLDSLTVRNGHVEVIGPVGLLAPLGGGAIRIGQGDLFEDLGAASSAVTAPAITADSFLCAGEFLACAQLVDVEVLDSSTDGYGGGILNLGQLYLGEPIQEIGLLLMGMVLGEATTRETVLVQGNSADEGGGLWNGGFATVVETAFDDNEAEEGGGIYNATIFELIAGSRAGGIRRAAGAQQILSFGNLTLAASTVSRNDAVDGGGIYNLERVGMTNVTVSGNTATGWGGGIYNTIDDETASAGLVELVFCTVADNTAVDGGGIYTGNLLLLPRVFAVDTIVALNESNDCSTGLGGGAGEIFSTGGNLDSDGTCTFLDPTDHPGVDPRLSVLGDHGGATETHLLLTGSPAIDAAVDAKVLEPVVVGQQVVGRQVVVEEECGLAEDQRGFPRPIDGDGDEIARCDIGAVEVTPAAVTIADIPTLSGLGLGLLALLVAAGAAWALGRRRLA